MQGSDIRRSFLEFFHERGHTLVPSDLLVPKSDPTLLFTSAGMVQFKAHFLGKASDGLTRAATCQKCFRTSDIEEVGDSTHHTFFEMLGNFSFGDYFKREAIAWGWEYVTQVLKIPAESLWVTYYEEDPEAAEIWDKEIGVSPSRIIPTGKQDNWWGPAGDTGPCGPCSEIHVDRGPAFGKDNTITNAGARFIEIWNLVFTQFDRQADGSMMELPQKNIDTGAGLERIAAILQGAESTLTTDLLRPIITHAESLCGMTYGDHPDFDRSLRVLADHGRAVAFCISDGVMPGNIGRGYVLRRIIRRAVRHGRRLGIEKPFLAELAAVNREIMGGVYPNLAERLDYVQRVETAEEESFARTLSRGAELLEQLMDEVKSRGGKTLPGGELFRLFDTYGFPYDLTEEIARENGLECDRAGFEAEMDQQRRRARSAWKGSGEEGYHDLPADLLSTRTTFLGYDESESPDCEVLALLVRRTPLTHLHEDAEAEIILDRTPFYAEAGGQVGDVGDLVVDDLIRFEVTDTQKTPQGVYLHSGRLVKGELAIGERVLARVDAEKRTRTMAHHSATHLLQAALRQVIGTHVQQSGSRVSPESLRFDFTHFEAVPPEQVAEIERRVNCWIWQNVPVTAAEMDLEEAKAAGAMALFGEKYGERVRVIRMGEVSRELCGGTHVPATGSIGPFHIVKESSISAGNRRIEAVVGPAAWEILAGHARMLDQLAELVRAKPGEQLETVRQLAERVRNLEKELSELRAEQMRGAAADLASRARGVDGARILVAALDASQAAEIDAVMDGLRDRLENAVILLAAERDGRVVFLCTVSDTLVERGLHAGNLVKELARLTGGGGGGKPTRAQSGGKDPARLPEALSLAERRIEETLTKQG